MPTVHEVTIEPLTEDAFAPFGQIISTKERTPDFQTESGTQGWAIDFHSGRPLLMVLRTPHQRLRFSKLERHFEQTQTFLTAADRHHLDLGAREVAIGRDQREPFDGGLQDEGMRVCDGFVTRQRIVDGPGRRALSFQADAARQVALGIGVDDEHPLACLRKRGSQVDGRRGLPNAPLLVRDGDDAAHLVE